MQKQNLRTQNLEESLIVHKLAMGSYNRMNTLRNRFSYLKKDQCFLFSNNTPVNIFFKYYQPL